MINRKTFAAAIFLILFSVEVSGQNRDVLQGLGMVRVAVDIGAIGQRLVSSDQIKTDVELNLRRNGIVVTGDRNSLSPDGETPTFPPYVYVNINAIEAETASGRIVGFTSNISLQFNEIVFLNRDSPKKNRATVLSFASINTYPDGSSATQGIRQVVRDLVDQFSNDYLAANPITR